jgi:hypothetical protein
MSRPLSPEPAANEPDAFAEPEPTQLFSVTNAGFFTRTEGVPTTVPFSLLTAGGDDSLGLSYRRGIGDEDYEAPKLGVMFGSIREPETQPVGIETFPSHYEYEDAPDYLSHVGGDIFDFDTWDTLVSFTL